MELVTEELRERLLSNWDQPHGKTKPALKIFSPTGAATWLIHSMDPEDNDQLHGLCDLGYGAPELGTVSLSELQEIHIILRASSGAALGSIRLERDLYFDPEHTMAEYTKAAQQSGRITEEQPELEAAAWG